jgi:hypothetical protein
MAVVPRLPSPSRLVATLVSLVEDLLMLPVTLAVSFGSVATLLLFFRCAQGMLLILLGAAPVKKVGVFPHSFRMF